MLRNCFLKVNFNYICNVNVKNLISVDIMKRLSAELVMVLVSAYGFAQEKPSLEQEGNLVKATYTNDEGAVTQIGYFKDGKLHGEWVTYNEEGKKTAIANYENGKKVGTWFFWNGKNLSEVSYNDNTLVAVNHWEATNSLATNP